MTPSRKIDRNSGFTLIEIIASLLLVAFMSVFAGSVIVTFTKGYLFAKENVHISQKAQLAVSRINRELLELLDVTSASNTAITIESESGIRTIGLNDGNIKIAETGVSLANGDILIDDVSNFSLSYYAGTSPWAQGMDIRLLSAIIVSTTLARTDGGNITFETTVHPRNTNNYGGAPPTAEPSTKLDYCFLATAAFGNSDHPMVQILRKFRDRFLLTWKGGQRVVSAYYAVGPAFAKTIKDYEWVAPFVRLMLLPVVGFAVFMLIHPLTILLFPVISWLSARMMIALVRRSHSTVLQRLLGSKGTVLIGLIVTMVIISALGAAMLPLTSTSTFSSVRANSAGRAYFLAESGLRFAASEYLNAGSEIARNSRLQTMHTQGTYTLQDDEGIFQLAIYPYFFSTTSNPIGGQTLQTAVPGAFPPNLVLSSGKLQVGANFYDYSSAAVTDPNVTFTMTQNMPYVPVNSEVFYAATSLNTQTVAKGGNLLVQSGSAYTFPLRNGSLAVVDINNDTVICSYKQNDLTNNQLTGIDFPADPGRTSVSIAGGTDIGFQKFIELHTTGTFGQGEVAVSRENVYYVPLPTATLKTVEFVERFEDKSNWEDSTKGAHEIQEIGGDKALKVTGTSEWGGAPKASLIKLDWSAADVDLAEAWRYGGSYLLSYDAQVKVGFDASTTPQWGFEPPGSPIPKYYVAGLSFRLDDNNNSYGLSFMRGDNSIPSPYDNIDDDIVPVNGKPLIVLWQQTNSGANRTWLAYKEYESVSDLAFSDDVENGENGWTATGTPTPSLWNIQNRNKQSPEHAWYYGRQTAPFTYNTGARNTGTLVSPPINLCYATSALLSFWSWYSTEYYASPYPSGWAPEHVNIYDKKLIQISEYNGTNWVDVYQTQIRYPTNLMKTWEKIEVDLSSYAGKTIRVKFFFDTVDANFNDFEGWYIDDVTVSGNFTFPPNESTLMVRIKEAASIAFSNGAITAIVEGETVVGQTSGATGIVDGKLNVESGSWAGGNAAGTMTLHNVSGTFQDLETLYVIGSFASAVVQVQGYRDRDNFIRAYYGTPTGCGTPDGSLLNEQRGGNARSGDINWPPASVDEWASNRDHFTLIQWDAINGSVASVALIPSLDEPEAIIRSNAIMTPTSGTFTQAELGLHTFGHGSTNVYFDDFALQVEIVTTAAISPVQE